MLFISGEKVTSCSIRTLNSEMFISNVKWLICFICVLMTHVFSPQYQRTQGVTKPKVYKQLINSACAFTGLTDALL